MSLKTKKKTDLEAIANALFVEVEEGATKAEIIAALTEADVTEEDYKDLEVLNPDPEPSGIVKSTDFATAVEPVAEPVTSDAKIDTTQNSVLIRCSRQNNTFEILSYKFTKEAPFQAVKPEDAEYIIQNIPGFRPALQSEVQSFYGG